MNAIKSLVDEKYRLRLITQLHYQNQFEQEILNGVKLPETSTEREENRFKNAALIFKDRLQQLIKDGGISIMKKFVDYLLNKVVMVTITCSNREYAIKLFQVINTRGLDLSNADLLKSQLYSELHDKIEQEQFIATWREIENTSKQIGESLDDLFTYYEYYLLAQNPKRTLYEELKDQFKNKDSNGVVYDFKKLVESYDEIANAHSKLIYSFRYLPNQVFWKAILTTAKKESFSDFEGLCKQLRKVYYSYWIAGYTTSKIKQLSFNLVQWIKNRKSLDYIKDEINKKMRYDNVIQRVTYNLKRNVYGSGWVKPLLVLIEYEQTDDSKVTFIELDRKLHVDHILPQEWQRERYWREEWDEFDASEWLNKIGNLTLLSGRKNVQASNNTFEEKKKIYKGKGLDGTTAFIITQEIITKSDWRKPEVQNRQFEMKKAIERVLEIEIEWDKPWPSHDF